MMTKKTYLLTIALTASLFTASSLVARVYIIGNIERTIRSYEKAIKAAEAKAGISRIQKELDEKLEEKKKVENELNLTDLEKQKRTLEKKRDIAATLVYQKSVSEKTRKNLFVDVNRIIYQIFNDQNIKIKLNKIIELQRQIAEAIKNNVDDIQKLGKEIEEQITKAKVIQQLKAAQSALLPVTQNIKQIELSPEAVEKLSPLRSELIRLNEEIKKEISRLPTASRTKIQRLKNAIRRLEIILEYLRNPDRVQAASEGEILGIG